MHIDRRILCDGNKTTRTTMNGIQLHRWSCFVQSPGKTLFCTWNYSCFCHKKKTTKNQKKLNEFSQRQTNKFPHKMLLWSNAFPRFCMLVVFVLLNVLIFFSFSADSLFTQKIGVYTLDWASATATETEPESNVCIIWL